MVFYKAISEIEIFWLLVSLGRYWMDVFSFQGKMQHLSSPLEAVKGLYFPGSAKIKICRLLLYLTSAVKQQLAHGYRSEIKLFVCTDLFALKHTCQQVLPWDWCTLPKGFQFVRQIANKFVGIHSKLLGKTALKHLVFILRSSWCSSPPTHSLFLSSSEQSNQGMAMTDRSTAEKSRPGWGWNTCIVQKNVPKKTQTQKRLLLSRRNFLACLCRSTLSPGCDSVQELRGQGDNTAVGATSSLACMNPHASLAWDSQREMLVASGRFISFFSALIMKFHSIMGPSYLCDCRNYHLPN